MTCDAYMESLIAGGYVEELDLCRIPNSSNINPAYWPSPNHSIPYLGNYIYVVYNTETCPIEITCYNDPVSYTHLEQLRFQQVSRNGSTVDLYIWFVVAQAPAVDLICDDLFPHARLPGNQNGRICGGDMIDQDTNLLQGAIAPNHPLGQLLGGFLIDRLRL